MPDRHPNSGGLEETAAGAAEAVAGNAGTGPAASAHFVEGANYRTAGTRHLSHRKDYSSKPAGALRHRKFLCPNGPAKSLPTILYLCGHSPHPLGAKVEYQDRAAWFASHGYPCLVLDTLEFG